MSGRKWNHNGKHNFPTKMIGQSLGFISLAFIHLLLGFSFVQSSSVKDVMVAWRRRMKNTWVSDVWKMILWVI